MRRLAAKYRISSTLRTGVALVGHYAGQLLTPLPATIISYQDFKRSYPHGGILPRDTGYRRPYGRNPYRGY